MLRPRHPSTTTPRADADDARQLGAGTPTTTGRRPGRLAGLGTTVAAVGLLTLAGPAGAAGLPSAPTGTVRVSVTTPSGWTVEDRGPGAFPDGGLTQLVVRRPGGAVDALLYPETKAGPSCDPGAASSCRPMRSILESPNLRMGEDGLLVTDRDGDGTPEVAISLYTGGAHCCVITVGFWRDPAGVWRSDRTNGGSAGGVRSDASGRVETADPAFEGLDWAYAVTQPFVTWTRLVPGTGWVDATTSAEHRRQIASMDRVIRRASRRPEYEGAVQAARAVRIGHRHALRQTGRVAAERRTYRRAYGRGDLRTLDRALRGIARVR